MELVPLLTQLLDRGEIGILLIAFLLSVWFVEKKFSRRDKDFAALRQANDALREDLRADNAALKLEVARLSEDVRAYQGCPAGTCPFKIRITKTPSSR